MAQSAAADKAAAEQKVADYAAAEKAALAKASVQEVMREEHEGRRAAAENALAGHAAALQHVHDAQSAKPSAAAYEPVLHAAHAPASLLESPLRRPCWPAGHDAHDVLPSSCWYCPLMQLTHSMALVVVAASLVACAIGHTSRTSMGGRFRWASMAASPGSG